MTGIGKIIYLDNGVDGMYLATFDDISTVVGNIIRTYYECKGVLPDFEAPFLFEKGRKPTISYVKNFPYKSDIELEDELLRYQQEDNYHRRNAWRSKYMCPCGSYIRQDSQYRHEQSKKHKLFEEEEGEEGDFLDT